MSKTKSSYTVNDVEITNKNDVVVRINFILDDYEYFYVFLDKKKNARVVHTPLHNFADQCPLCIRNRGRCYDLIDSLKEEVLPLVINHPSVRLRLLARGFL